MGNTNDQIIEKGVCEEDEKKFCEVDTNEEDDMDYRLVGLETFYSKLCRSEKLLVKNENGDYIDRRTKVILENPKFNFKSYTRLSQMIGKNPQGKRGTGSSTRIDLNGVPCMIRCAHNLCTWSVFNNEILMHQKARIYEGRQGHDAWIQLWKLDTVKSNVHPMYAGKIDSGFDIGIARLEKKDHKLNGEVKIDDKSIVDDCDLAVVDPKNIQSGMKVEIAGYPGDDKFMGYPFTHSGKIVDIVNKPDGGCLVYYNVDTTVGNSGACIMVTDESYIEKYSTKPGIRKLIIGVHNGHSDGEYNYGSLITPSIFKWMSRKE